MTHFVAAIGTGGTVMGTGRFLKSKNRAIKVIAVEPDDAMHGLEGLKHMASSIVPGIYHEKELDDKIQVGTEEAYEMVYALGQTEGILVGQSSGAAMIAALKLARSIREGTIVTVFCDFGDEVPIRRICGSDGRNGVPSACNKLSPSGRTNNPNGTYPRTSTT